MLVFLRSRRPLRCLLALALFAWAMLAIAPVGAWPTMGSTTPRAHASHDSMHLDKGGCCDDHAGLPDRDATPPCHCALPCAGVLPAMLMGLAALPMTPARYGPPRSIEAPLSGFAPPLRPPLA